MAAPSSEPAETDPSSGPPVGRLGLWDAVSIIVGIVIGATIFKAPTLIFANVSGPWEALAAWGAGGVLSLVGALCYAELATAYPRSGGDYVYLSRAYGPGVGFLFGWAHLAGILTGSVGALAFVFAEYAAQLAGLGATSHVAFAVGAVGVLTLTNLAGIVLGKAAQDVLALAKVLGLAMIVAAGFLMGRGEWSGAGSTAGGGGLGLAMVLVLYAYGGWNDAAFVAAEVRDRRRNVPLALVGGIGAITLIYLLVNAAYLWGLGFEGARALKEAPASVLLMRALGPAGAQAMGAIVMVSTLGGINGLVLTGSRVHASLGTDYRGFGWLATWTRRGAPVGSLLAQAAVTVVLVVAVGTSGGRVWIDLALAAVGRRPVEWDTYGGGFDTLVAATAPVFWFFFLLTGLSVIVLRVTDPRRERPFRAPLFPATPVVFCLMCGWMLWKSVAWAGDLALVAVVPLACGIPLYFISRRGRNAS